MPRPPKMGPNRLYLGIDPGKKGGLALIDSRLQVVALELMPKTGSDFYRWVNYQLVKPGVDTAVITIERVHSMSGQGSQSTFTFGMELGKCETILDIVRYLRQDNNLGETQILTPTPQKWMKGIVYIERLVNDFKTKTLWKRYLRSVAKELFPKAELWRNSWWNEGRTDSVSDALLIAYYGWLQEELKGNPDA